MLNDDVKKSFFVIIPEVIDRGLQPEIIDNYNIVYTDNVYFVSQFINKTVKWLGLYRRDIYKYTAVSEDELFHMVLKDFSVELTVNNKLEQYLSSDETLSICISELMYEWYVNDADYETYARELYCNLDYLDCHRDVLIVPKELASLFDLLQKIYAPLIALLNVTDVYCVYSDQSNFGRILHGLLDNRYEGDPSTVSILDVVDYTKIVFFQSFQDIDYT